jgi:hypothetical protein
MGMIGPGKFLPQQFPAQNLIDQAISSKYSSATLAMSHRLRGDGFTAGTDNAEIFERLKGLRSRFDKTALTPLGEAQMRNSAQIVNNDLTQALLSATVGPQVMEDLFFGQRGSREMLGRSVASIGFYRPDAVTGRERMTEQSLETFTNQIYSNLYGPDADLNDISGFSAGRTGTIMTDLARRGLLPASISKLTTEERRRSIRDNATDIGKLKLSPDIVKALEDDAPFEEIAQMAGGADAVRKIDATRVSNSLKEYSKAISTVREIFGDNGISNAPMGQLLAAMEALTQNSMGSMGPGKLENLMRRTQMAARDSGVSLEGLLGLTARAGAVADQNGLSRDYAPDAVIASMERVRALRENGGFAPGFGRMDPDKAAIAFAEQNVQADASPVARLVAVAKRAIKENLLNPAVKGGDDQLKALVNAIGSGQTMMYDPKTNKQIDIYEELGRNPDAFLKPMFDAAGITPELASSLYNSPGVEEYLGEMPGRQFHLVQPGEVKTKLGDQIAATGRFGEAMLHITDDATREELNAELSHTFAKTAINVVSTQMKPEERTAAYRNALRNVFIRRAFSESRVEPGNMTAATEYADNEMGRIFGGDAGINQFIGARAGELDAHLEGLFPGLTLPNAQLAYADKNTSAAAQIHRTNMSRINLFDSMRGSGSNPYQRLSDYIVSGEGSAIDAILGTVDKGEIVGKIKDNMQAGDAEKFDALYKTLVDDKSALYVDTPEERDAVLKAAANGELSAVIDQFKDTDPMSLLSAVHAQIKDKKTYQTTDQVAAAIKTHISDDKNPTALADAAELYTQKGFKGEFKATDEQLKQLASIDGVHSALGMTIAPDMLTESALKTFLETTRAFNISSDSDRPSRAEMIKRDEAFNSYTRSHKDGTYKSKDILEMVGVSADIAENEDTNKMLTDFLLKGEDAQSEALYDQLVSNGTTPEQAENIISAGRFAYALGGVGGLDSVNAANVSEYNTTTSRAMAVLKAAEDGMIDKKSRAVELATLHAQGKLTAEKDKEEYKETFSDTKKLSDELSAAATPLPGNKYGVAGDDKKQTGSRSGVDDKILADAQEREKALRPPDLSAVVGGLGEGLASVGTNIAAAIKEAFNGEITIQTAKIEKLELNLGDIASKIGSSITTVSSPRSRDGEIKGSVRLAGDLKTVFLNIINEAKESVESPTDPVGAGMHV